MKNRIWALVQVGTYISIEEMLKQIKEDEVMAIYDWLKLGHANTHGLSQVREMQCNERYSEIVSLGGRKCTDAIYEYCRDRVIE